MFQLMKRTIPYWLLLVATFIPLFAFGISNHGLWTADEPRVAEIGREMALTGNWAVPTLNRKPFLEKPPLYFWSLAATFKIFGVSDRVARIPSAIFGFGGVVSTFLLASMILGKRVGFLSAFILATSFEYFRVAHWLLVDSALAFFVISAMTAFMAGYLSERHGRRFSFYTLFYFFCGLAFLTKGFIGLVFPGLGVLFFLIFDRNLKAIWQMHLWVGIAVFIVLTLPWFLALWHQGGSEYLNIFFIKNHLQRFLAGGTSGHHRPFYDYLIQFPASFLPWSLLLAPALYRVFSGQDNLSDTPGRGRLFMKCWFISGFLFLSFASTKRGVYLLPVLAPIAILTACWIDSTLASRSISRMENIFSWVFGLVIMATGLMLIPVHFYLSGEWTIPFFIHLVLIIGFSGVSLKFLREKKISLFWGGSQVALFSLILFILLWTIPLIDRHKSFVSFSHKVKDEIGDTSILYAYKPDETMRGIVPFYTGRYVEEVEDKNLLQGILEKKEKVFIIAADKRKTLEKEVLSTGKAGLLIRQLVGNRRICLLFTNSIKETISQ